MHEGELVDMTFPAWVHRALQDRIAALLKQVLPKHRVLIEMPFEPGNNVRSADVGVIASERERAAIEAGVFPGSPDLVVEVLSPSSRSAQVAAYKKLCFDHDTLVFWTVDPRSKLVSVSVRGESAVVSFEVGESIPLSPLHPLAKIPVAGIFEIFN